MPGWHAKTKNLVAEGKLKVAGIVQEQHPNRAMLYMQWQQMDWPVLADPFNELGIKVVPITLLIDQHGIIRFKNPKESDLKEFLAASYDHDAAKLKTPAARTGYSDFKKGVTFRQRFDSPERQPDDFENAVRFWEKALALDPDQYIWRRRIQQYGPRLDKPYSFYDWVTQAREEIIARGDIPHPLTAEPSGSEFARPARRIAESAALAHPDPNGKVSRDLLPLVAMHPVVVPSTKGDGGAVRIHIQLTPRAENDIHWSDDVGPVQFFLEPDSPVTIHDLSASAPAATGKRTLEFELRPKDGASLPESFRGAAFYYICEGAEGACRFLRNDIVISLR